MHQGIYPPFILRRPFRGPIAPIRCAMPVFDLTVRQYRFENTERRRILASQVSASLAFSTTCSRELVVAFMSCGLPRES